MSNFIFEQSIVVTAKSQGRCKYDKSERVGAGGGASVVLPKTAWVQRLVE